jgi:extracellular elastinolytic metalloproteinase
MDALRASAASLSSLARAPQVTIAKFDPITGNPAVVKVESAPAALEGAGNYIQRALELVQNIKEVLGLAPTQGVEFESDPIEQQGSSGAVAVHLQQKYKGIPIMQATQTVRFAPGGVLTETVGSSITIAQEVSVVPQLHVEEAVLRAAQHCAMPGADELGGTDPYGQSLNPQGVEVTGFVPRVTATFPDKPDQPTVLEPGPFHDVIRASLIWFPLDRDLRLAWEVILTMPNATGQFRTLVDTQNGAILYCRDLVQSVAARGSVYRRDGSQERQMIDFPPPWADYGVPIPNDLRDRPPDDWVETDNTAGNSVNAHLGDSGPALQGMPQNGVLTFTPAEPFGDDQKILNIFYYNCYMHDFFYLLGFQEASGNFQRHNFHRGGLPNDAVDARAHSGAVWGTANFLTPLDGSNPTMNMGLLTATGRHTAFDASVVFHEFTHGVTNRLVGGPANTRALEEPQSRGMGEGWSDYIACTITDSPVVAAWVAQNTHGIRQFPYDSTFPAQTDNFGSLGTGRYSEVHNIGEIWCATLMAMNRNLATTLGRPEGVQLALQLVVDALKLSPANPSFLDARDAILTALDNKHTAGQLSTNAHAMAHRGIWAAFAQFGMGPGAQSHGPSLAGIVADMYVPPDVQPAPPGLSSVYALNLHCEFPSDAIKEQFKRDFQVWLKHYEQQVTRQRGLQASRSESYGFPAATQAGLGSLPGQPVSIYVNFITRW